MFVTLGSIIWLIGKTNTKKPNSFNIFVTNKNNIKEIFMSNRKILLSLLILALVIGGYFLLKKDKSSTLVKDETSFAVENTAEIDQIFMKAKFLNTSATLTKKDNKWTINNKYDADGSKINVLLTAIREVRVKHPVSKDYWDMVIRNLAGKGTKVELYSKGKKIKTYYVGGPTPDNTGTYMWIEGAAKPYICHIEGFVGYLTPRYFVNEADWRSKMIFELQEEDIEWVKVDWTENKDKGFLITNSDNGPSIERLSNQSKQQNAVNANKLKSYLKQFDRLSYEGFPNNKSKAEIDSIYTQTTPFVILTVKAKNKEEKSIRIHRKGLSTTSKSYVDEYGVKLPFEQDNYFAFINNNKKEMMQLQDFVFGKILKTYDDFLLE
jgi:hypothetical protein